MPQPQVPSKVVGTTGADPALSAGSAPHAVPAAGSADEHATLASKECEHAATHAMELVHEEQQAPQAPQVMSLSTQRDGKRATPSSPDTSSSDVSPACEQRAKRAIAFHALHGTCTPEFASDSEAGRQCLPASGGKVAVPPLPHLPSKGFTNTHNKFPDVDFHTMQVAIALCDPHHRRNTSMDLFTGTVRDLARAGRDRDYDAQWEFNPQHSRWKLKTSPPLPHPDIIYSIRYYS